MLQKGVFFQKSSFCNTHVIGLMKCKMRPYILWYLRYLLSCDINCSGEDEAVLLADIKKKNSAPKDVANSQWSMWSLHISTLGAWFFSRLECYINFLEDSDTVDSFDLLHIIYSEMRKTSTHLCQDVNMPLPMCFCVKLYICKYVNCVHVDMY